MTLYLKYRPQKIAELDLVSVRKSLGEMLGAKSLPHAFLFTGSRGTGKTSSARILAKAVNCLNRSGFEPCGVCEMCEAITNGSCPDVIEIDAASNRGIDEIRTLREQVNLSPMHAKYKVYIIDEVHMLTVEAMNALLKTLEEPPKHVVFVLCTTEANKILPTIVSRCIQIQFGQPTLTEIGDRLGVVAKAEELTLSPEDVLLIAKAGKGSFRDSIKILEQVMLARGDVRSVLGMLETASPEQFITLVKTNKTTEALALVELLVSRGISPRGFIEQTVMYLREELLAKALKLENVADHIKLISGLERAYEQSRTTSVPQLPLELFILEQTQKTVLSSGLSVSEPKAKSPETSTNLEPIPVVTIAETKVEVKVTPKIEEIKEETKPMPVGDKNLDDLIAKWPEILKLVKAQNNSIEALLRSTKPKAFNGIQVELEVFYTFHKDKLESEKCRLLIEKAVGDAFGSAAAKLKLVLGEKKAPAKADNIGGKVGEDIVAAAEAIFGVQAV